MSNQRHVFGWHNSSSIFAKDFALGDNGHSHTEDEDAVLEADEPPDHSHHWHGKNYTSLNDHQRGTLYNKQAPSALPRQMSLLSQGLAGSQPHSPAMPPYPPTRTKSRDSDASLPSTVGLISDAGNLSPVHSTSPSPYWSATSHAAPLLHSLIDLSLKDAMQDVQIISDEQHLPPTQTAPIEEPAVPRPRCITFACTPRPSSISKTVLPIAENSVSQADRATNSAAPVKKACTLKFVCPSRPDKVDSSDHSVKRSSTSASKTIPSPKTATPHEILETQVMVTSGRTHRDSEATLKDDSKEHVTSSVALATLPFDCETEPKVLKKVKAKDMHYTDLASTQLDDDSWVNNTPEARPRLTITDTLRKEAAIRAITEEVEDEAVGEEDENDDDQSDDENSADGDCEIACSTLDQRESAERQVRGHLSEADLDNEFDDFSEGMESDDEEGFADSDDDEDDTNPDFQFWTFNKPGELKLAKTPQPTLSRVRSNSSFEASSATDMRRVEGDNQAPRVGRIRRTARMRPLTPELPDSTDFVCGTLDEDRPLEAAFQACLLQKRNAKRAVIPQDLDPTFPTSENDDDDEEDDDDDDDEENDVRVKQAVDAAHKRSGAVGEQATPKKAILMGKPPAVRSRQKSPMLYGRSPVPVARRRSPAPMSKRSKSPAPRHLFGDTIHRPLSPNLETRLVSPPPSLQRVPHPSSPMRIGNALAQRPTVMLTKSLPKTPNPFWAAERKHQRKEHAARHAHNASGQGRPVNIALNRGAIDIVQGLETKKARRREKLWRLHCQHSKRAKERSCIPGKGAERMKELGLEMAGRSKAYGQKLHLMLSV